MQELILYIIIGLLLGFIAAGFILKFWARSPKGDSDLLLKRIQELESELNLSNDRLVRANEELRRLNEEKNVLTIQREELSTRLSSANTLLEELRKQNAQFLHDNETRGEELKVKINEVQELNRKIAVADATSSSQIQQIEKCKKDEEVLVGENKSLQREVSVVRERAVELEKENKYLKEMLDKQKQEVEEIGQKFTSEFKVLANTILEDKSKRFTEMNQTNIEKLLKPLGDNISQFQRKVEEVYDRESKERFSLGKEVEKLVLLNQKISEEANNLTNALKGQVKQQGNWGEMILESILEKSGLSKGREYFVQESLKDEEGKRLQPDVIIAYPDNRKVIIDSKVSLVAYERYCSASNPEEQEKALAEHLRSVRSHVDILSSKSYQDLVGSLDFVMMFVPIEPAFILAMQSGFDIWSYAYNRRVLLISPTNLIAALKLIYDLWQREHQNRHALEIAERGGQLYDKFVGLAESLSSVGDNLAKTQKSFDGALGQLTTGKGNLVSQVQKLKELGAKAKKSIPNELLNSLDELPEGDDESNS